MITRIVRERAEPIQEIKEMKTESGTFVLLALVKLGGHMLDLEKEFDAFDRGDGRLRDGSGNTSGHEVLQKSDGISDILLAHGSRDDDVVSAINSESGE